MTDRFNSLTVVLDQDIREDDAEDLLTAIRQMKHVLDVRGNVADPGTWTAEKRAKAAIWGEIGELLADNYG